ncbi:hypothetical protein QBC39DRAFT_371598 [Podospora conica]|nr:hypothetical protein QBC39DRAFT_371598 [Schizothecium conicum]
MPSILTLLLLAVHLFVTAEIFMATAAAFPAAPSEWKLLLHPSVHLAAHGPVEDLEPPRQHSWSLFSDRSIWKHAGLDPEHVNEHRPAVQNAAREGQPLPPSHGTLRARHPFGRALFDALYDPTPEILEDDPSTWPEAVEVFSETDFSDAGSEAPPPPPEFGPWPEFHPSCYRRSFFLWTRRQYELRLDQGFDSDGSMCGYQVRSYLDTSIFCEPIEASWFCERIPGAAPSQVSVSFTAGAVCLSSMVEKALSRATGGEVQLQCQKWDEGEE